MEDLSRRKFLLASGAVATGAAVAATPKLVGAVAEQAARKEPAPKVVDPTRPAPREPVMAYVRDAATGEVTVMSGTLETTYRDPALVKRLLKAAPGTLSEGGVTNVLAP
jgi:hypothetical protein